MKSHRSRQVPAHWPAASDWTEILEDSLADECFLKLQQFVSATRLDTDVFPSAENVFEAFRLCSFADTKVVILGQDPYHGPGQAHGLAFSVQGEQRIPASLKNVFRELQDDLGPINKTGNLTNWARQGVLLLNTVLTVESGKANSHRNRGWEDFTDAVIEKIGQRLTPAVFILWGKPAGKKAKLIGSHHCVIESTHPSPLSAYRGFLGSRPFSQTNQALKQFGYEPVEWKL